MSRVPRRVVLGGLLLAALLIAGVLSFYASSSPDGLERVSEDHGFSSTAEDHAVADGPLADYRAEGVDDDRLSGGLAGVAGSLVVLLVAGSLTYALRRRAGDDEVPPGAGPAGHQPAGRTAGTPR